MKRNQSASLSSKNKWRDGCMSVFLFLLTASINAQINLVPNNYFEIYSLCPDSISRINYATGWRNAAPSTSPDYFNFCAQTSSYVSVPASIAGYQNDCCSGQGYAGIYAFNIWTPNDGREYIQIKLNDTLEAGRKYLAGLYVSNAGYQDYAISTIGMYFTTNAIQAPSGKGFINVSNPQVKNSSPLIDTLNWMLVQDTITGMGTELYLTIGNFNYDSLCDTIYTGNGYDQWPSAYYFIDNVFVIDAAFAGIEESLGGNDVKFFPNPAKDEVQISCGKCNADRLSIEIYDFCGKLISKNKFDSFTGTGNLQLNLENGIYFVKTYYNERTVTTKLIIQK